MMRDWLGGFQQKSILLEQIDETVENIYENANQRTNGTSSEIRSSKNIMSSSKINNNNNNNNNINSYETEGSFVTARVKGGGTQEDNKHMSSMSSNNNNNGSFIGKDCEKFVIEGRPFSFKNEIYLKLVVYNSDQEEIVRCAFSDSQFAKFLGFLKAKAKFQSQIPLILSVPSNDFEVETAQRAFNILQESRLHHSENFMNNYISSWKKEYAEYTERINQLQIAHHANSAERGSSQLAGGNNGTIQSVRDKMETIGQKIRRLPKNAQNIHQVHIGLEKYDNFLEHENNQAKIRTIIHSQFRYQLRELIGKGAYGLVYAIDLDHNQNQAIKIQVNQNNSSAEFKKCEELQNFALQSIDGDILHFFKCFQIQDSYSKEVLDFFIMERGEKNLKQLTMPTSVAGKKDFTRYWNKQEIRSMFIGIMRNVAFLHSCNYYHRDIKYDNIIKKRQVYYLIDFNVSEKIETTLPLAPKLERAKDRATFLKQDVLSGTPGYLTPQWDSKYQEIKAAKSDPKKNQSRNDWNGIHDPFKSDLYSLGVVFVQFLQNVKLADFEENERFIPSKEPRRAYPLSKEVSAQLLTQANINVNQYFTLTHQFLIGDEIFGVQNLLVSLLEPKESERISTLKLSLICQLFSVVINNYVNMHTEYFPPEETPYIDVNEHKIGDIIEKKGKIKYKFKNQEYVGDFICKIEEDAKHQKQKVLARSGYGELYEMNGSLNNKTKTLIYIGKWANDLPHGDGKYHFFSGAFQYIGTFNYGVFHGKGTIYYNNPCQNESVIGDNQQQQQQQENGRHYVSGFKFGGNLQFSQLTANTLGLGVKMASSQMNYIAESRSAVLKQPLAYTPVVIYQGEFLNFILKDWLLKESSILEEGIRYSIRLNATKPEQQPMYIVLKNTKKTRVIEMTIKAFKSYAHTISLFLSEKFEQFELNLVQDDSVNAISVGVIYGPQNSVRLFFESFAHKPQLSLEDYQELIKFGVFVDEINFEFLTTHQEENSLIQMFQGNQKVKQALFRCRAMRGLSFLDLKSPKEIITEFPNLEEADLSNFAESQIIEIGLAIAQYQSTKRRAHPLTNLCLSQFVPNVIASLFESDYFSSITSMDFSSSEITSSYLLKLFRLPGTENLLHLSLSYCESLSDAFLVEWVNQAKLNVPQSPIRYFCVNLETLNLSGLKILNSNSWTTFLTKATFLSNLKELYLMDIETITDAVLKASFKTSKIFNKSLQFVSVSSNPRISYKAFKYLASPKLERISQIDLSFSDIFEVDRFKPNFLRKAKHTKVLEGLDVSNCASSSGSNVSEAVKFHFIDAIFANNYVIKQLKFSIDQIDKQFCQFFHKNQILRLMESICVYYDPTLKIYDLANIFFNELISLEKQVYFVTEQSEKSELQLSLLLDDILPDHKNIVFINSQMIPLAKYRPLKPRVLNDIQLLEIPLEIEQKGSVSKLIRHEKFREKDQLDLSSIPNILATEIVDSLVISDHSANLRVLNLSNSNLNDSDIHLFCTNGQFAISTLVFNNCRYVSEKGINEILTAKNIRALNLFQVKGIYRNLGSVSLQDANARNIKLIIDRVSITYAKSKMETLRQRDVITKYLHSHSSNIQKMRIEVLDQFILSTFIKDSIDYSNINTLQLSFSTAPLQAESKESKRRSVEQVIQLVGNLVQINHLVLTFDEQFIAFLVEHSNERGSISLVSRLNAQLQQLVELKSLHLKQEYSDSCQNQIISEDQIEGFYLGILESVSRLTSKLSFKLNMKPFMWNLLKKQKLTDQCVIRICNAIAQYSNLECLTLQLSAWGHQNNMISNYSVNVLVSLISSFKPEIFKKLNLDLAYWASKNLSIELSSLQRIFAALQLLPRLTSLQVNLAGWGQNIRVTNESVRDVFSKITILNQSFSSVTSFNLNASEWNDLGAMSMIEIINFTQRSFQSLVELSLNLSEWKSQDACLTSEVIQSLGQLLTKKSELRFLSLDISASIFGKSVKLTSQDVRIFADSILNLQHLEFLRLILNRWGDDISTSSVASLSNSIKSLTKLKAIHLEMQNWPQLNANIMENLQAMEQQSRTASSPNPKKTTPLAFSFPNSSEENEGSEQDLRNFIRNLQYFITLPSKKLDFNGWGSMEENITKLMESVASETLYIPSYQTTQKTNRYTLE